MRRRTLLLTGLWRATRAETGWPAHFYRSADGCTSGEPENYDHKDDNYQDADDRSDKASVHRALLSLPVGTETVRRSPIGPRYNEGWSLGPDLMRKPHPIRA